MKRRIALLLIVVLCLTGVGFFSSKVYKTAYHAWQRHLVLQKRKAAWPQLRKRIETELNSFDGSVGLVIEDLDTGLEITHNANLPIPSASLVKIPIMAACFEAIQKGDLKLDETIMLTERRKTPGSGVLKAERSGGSYTIGQLLEIMIVHSDNSASNMLIERLGIGYFDDAFKKMGLKNTNLARKMMDFQSRKMGVENYTTARDIAMLLDKMYRGTFLNRAVSRECLRILTLQKVNDRIPKKLPPGTIVAHKTGLERFVCHDAGIVYTDKGNFLITALTKHRFKAAQPAKKVIIDLSYETYEFYDALPSE
jgi:beta-lactamase class A